MKRLYLIHFAWLDYVQMGIYIGTKTHIHTKKIHLYEETLPYKKKKDTSKETLLYKETQFRNFKIIISNIPPLF